EGQLPATRVEEIAIPGDFLRTLHLGQVEVNALPPSRLRASCVEERERGAEDARGHGTAVHAHLRLVAGETALAVRRKGQLAGGGGVGAGAGGVGEGERPVHGGESVVGGAYRVAQPVARRVFVVVEVALGALAFRPRVERVDEHAGDRAGA